jgi:hypothetical protein
MAVQINNNGDLVITIPKQDGFSPFDELELRKTAIYDAIVEHDNNDFIGSDVHYGLTQLLKDLEPSPAQWEAVLKNPNI